MHRIGLVLVFTGIITVSAYSQKSSNNREKFRPVKFLDESPVKDQYRSNTCWDYSTIGMLESELLRQGKGSYDLSEMFIVWHTYAEKAIKYIRLHGNMSFTGGGFSNDVIDVIRKYGIVPNSVYDGLRAGKTLPDHVEMDKVLKSYLDGVLENQTLRLSDIWFSGFCKILDSYLGKIPAKFKYEGQVYTPKSFADSLGIVPDDYIMITSFTHHPFYSKFIIEVPDNWNWGEAYNLPLKEMMSVINNSLDSNYTVVWDADNSERGFSFTKGIAALPDLDPSASESDWNKALSNLGAEVTVTQSLRQEQFDKFLTTDDHGMQITGMADDDSGKLFYYVKNSWGTSNPYQGHLYASEAYMELKTISIMVNKHALTPEMRDKLGIQ